MEDNSEKKGDCSFHGFKKIPCASLLSLSFRHKTVSLVDFFPSSVCFVTYAKYLTFLPC